MHNNKDEILTLYNSVYLGIINYFLPNAPDAGILSLIGLLVFIVFFALGPGVVVWLAISELFPTQIRGKGMAICLFFNSQIGILTIYTIYNIANFIIILLIIEQLDIVGAAI